MQFLLRVSRWIDGLNTRVAKIADWMVLLAAVVSAGNAVIRYGFNLSSNAWLELQWYMFGVMPRESGASLSVLPLSLWWVHGQSDPAP